MDMMYKPLARRFNSGISKEILEKMQARFMREVLYYAQRQEVPDYTGKDEFLQALQTKCSNPLPVICIINGAGASGKDTFIDLVNQRMSRDVLNLSAIDPVKDLAREMFRRDSYHQWINGDDTAYDDVSDIADRIVAIEGEKSQAYRKFLSQMKAAWEEFDNGPTMITLGTLCNLLTIRIDKNRLPGVIFIHCREPEHIEKLINALHSVLGLLTLTVLIDGRTDPESFNNPSDRNVRDYPYSIVFMNNSDLENLDRKATWFAKTIEAINGFYGIQMPIGE